VKRLLILALAVFPLTAKTYTVKLVWKYAANAGRVTFNVYRASSPCSVSSSPARIGQATSKSYKDKSVRQGNYCYYVTAVYPGVESLPSNKVTLRTTDFTKRSAVSRTIEVDK
jgi:hypothetical protein